MPFTLSLWGTFVPAGIALAGLATADFADRADWRTIFAVDVVLLAARPDRRRPGRAARPARRDTTASGRRSARWRAPPPLSVAFFCFALLFLALAGLLPAWLVERRGLAVADAGRIAAIATAFGIAGSLLAGR